MRNQIDKYTMLLIVLSVLFFSVRNVPAQNIQLPESTKELVDFSARINPSPFRPGEEIRLIIDVDLQPGWHIYSVIPLEAEDAPRPTKIKLKEGLFSTEGPLYETRPVEDYIDVLNYSIFYHKNHAELYQNLVFASEPKPGKHSSEVVVIYQLCTDVICLPTETRTLDIEVAVEAGSIRPEFQFADRSINPLPEQTGISGITGLLSGGIWAFLGLAALMGLVSLMTPCVFPMIPITVSFFSKQAEGKQSRVIKLALLFMAGIIGSYTGFGLIMSAIFGAGSALSLAANPYVNLIIAAVFIVFAFSLMGAFNINLPTGIQSYFDQKSRTLGGALGVLLMGFTFTLTAFTCTVQFVGTMLIAAAQGEWMWPLFGMLVFSTVFAFPFFLLAVAPSLVGKMQGKSGEWLGRSKFVLGVLELMASVKFLSNADLVWQTNLISRNTAILIWIGLVTLIVVYLIWTGIRPKINKSPWQWGTVLVFGGMIVLLSRGWNDNSLGGLIDAVLPPPSGFHLSSDDYVSEEEAKQVVWLDNMDEAQKLALEANKPILLEFTGYTCVNCRWMEQNVLALKSVHESLKNDFILVKLFTDGGDDAKKNLNYQIDTFNTVALPYYVKLGKDSSFISAFSGISLKPQEFLDFLND
ncbi:MAG: thioredoxin family protein [Proteobacteria bacterium]|nr:thioredoxin family protein [Pseudomonadota bacterium]